MSFQQTPRGVSFISPKIFYKHADRGPLIKKVYARRAPKGGGPGAQIVTNWISGLVKWLGENK